MGLFDGIGEDLTRVREIVGVMRKHGFAPTLRRIPLVTRLVKAREGEEEDAGTAPQRFCRMLEELGPTFVKVGQILSTRQDILPPAFTEELSRLQDQVPPFAFEDVKKMIESELGKPTSELFDDLCEEPLASASMAQVHCATLPSGEEVVIKVQRPGIEDRVRADASILVLLSQLLELIIEEASAYRAKDLAEEFEKGLVAELDFTHEAENLKTFRALNRDREGVHIPKLYESHSSRRVMTMERIRGRRITALADDEAELREKIVERLVLVNFDHIFADGVFHGDPHPGNVFITDDGNIGFIDFGLMGRVARETQDHLLMLMIAIALRDSDTLARLMVRIGDAQKRVDLLAFRTQIHSILDRYLGLTVREVDTAAVTQDLIELSQRFSIRMPPEFAILSKASVSIDGIVRQLHSDWDPSKKLIARSEELLLERVDPRNLKGGGMRTALQLAMLAKELPLQLSQIFLDLEKGQLELKLNSEALDELNGNLRGLAMTIFGGFLAASFLLGGFYVLARYEWYLLGVPMLPAVAFTMAGGVFGVAFTWYLTGGRFRKISLGRWLLPRLTERRSSEQKALPEP
jgi:ubiquinone biosynthesis protein